MARGWESKSIESQVEDRQNAQKAHKHVPTAEERARAQERASLVMTRTNLERARSLTTSPVRRAALADALLHVSHAIDKLDSPPER